MVDIVNFNGDDNLVIQSTNINGTRNEQQKSFQEFVSPFSASYQERIKDLEETIKAKKRINGDINKEIIELYIKKQQVENEKASKEKQVAFLLRKLNGKDVKNTTSLFHQAFNYFIMHY